MKWKSKEENVKFIAIAMLVQHNIIRTFSATQKNINIDIQPVSIHFLPYRRYEKYFLCWVCGVCFMKRGIPAVDNSRSSQNLF